MRAARHAGPSDRQRGGDAQHDRHERERRQIQRPHSEQHRLNEPARQSRQHQADHGAGRDDARGLQDHETQHIVRRRTQRPAHAEIADVLLNRVGQHAEHADHRQHERQHREGDHHHGAEAMTAGGRPGDVFERHDACHADELLLVDAGNGPAD